MIDDLCSLVMVIVQVSSGLKKMLLNLCSSDSYSALICYHGNSSSLCLRGEVWMFESTRAEYEYWWSRPGGCGGTYRRRKQAGSHAATKKSFRIQPCTMTQHQRSICLRKDIELSLIYPKIRTILFGPIFQRNSLRCKRSAWLSSRLIPLDSSKHKNRFERASRILRSHRRA